MRIRRTPARRQALTASQPRRSSRHPISALGIVVAFFSAPLLAAQTPADLIFHNGKVWTLEIAQPQATAVAVRGDQISRVGADAAVLALRGPATEVIDLKGRLLLPGFNDAHTHLENAADWVFELSLFDARESSAILARVAEATRRVPKGFWITGGDYGAFAAWEAAAKRQAAPLPPVLDRKALDAASSDHPILLRRHDMAYVANSKALALARFTKEMPDPRGGGLERDPATGELTGVLYGRAGERLAELIPPPRLARKVEGARIVLRDFARLGITSIADVARLDDLSEQAVFHTHVERSSSNLDIFRELQRRGELTVRVYAFLTLRLAREVVSAGIRPRSDEGLIRFGALKSFVDGYLMEAPYADNPRYGGDFTFRFIDPETMAGDIAFADRNGFDPVVHAIGDKAHRLLLDWYEAAIQANPTRDRRFRVIHAEYPTPREVDQMGRLKLIADITPIHLLRNPAGVERRLGPERSRTAYPWQSLIKAGVRVNVVSDMPGSFNEQEEKPVSPLENMCLTVTRRPPGGGPAWHEEERLTIAQAIEGYTINPAYSSYEEDRKGSIREGKWADLVVLSRDILSLPPEALRETQVDYTVLGGKILYRRLR